MSGQNHLLRVLGVAFGIAAVIGGTIGQGILRSPGAVAAGVPDPLLMMTLWVVVGGVVAVDAMSTVELAASIRQTGGPFAFARRAFGAFTGLAVGLTDWLGNVAALAFVSVVCAEYFHRMGIATGVPNGVLAAAIPLVLGAIQLLGTRVSGWSQEVGSAVKAMLLIVLVAALLFSPRGVPVEPAPASPALTLLGVIGALRAVVGTYNGWNTAAYFCEEVTNPARSIVRATFAGIALVTLLYVLVNLALLQQLGPHEMAGDNLVAATAASRVFGPRADLYVTAISMILLITIANMVVMQAARILFAIGRVGGAPMLHQVAPNGAPQIPLAATAGLGAVFATIGIYATLLALSTALIAGVAIIVNLAAITMRRSEPDLERPYRMPLFPIPALFAATVNAGLLAAFVYEDPGSSAAGFAIMLALTALVHGAIRRHARRSAAAEAA